jgi:succinate dehydrogenase / fumarate reductase membrane anchor subunit
LGLQVVVEDYIHQPALEIALQVIIKIVFSFAAIAAVFAIARIALGA